MVCRPHKPVDYCLSEPECVGRLLHREGVRVCHVPDVALALNGTYNSTVSMLTAKAARQSTNEVGCHEQCYLGMCRTQA